MFWSYTLKDVVEVEPVYFPVESNPQASSSFSSSPPPPPLTSWPDLILHRLTERYVGKVIPRLGFCVAVEHILEYTPCEVKGPNGSAWLTAVFDVCVFAPVPGTRFRAKIAHQDETGLFLQMDFFASYRVFVPASQLIEGSVFDVASGQWALPVEDEENEEGGGADSAQANQPSHSTTTSGVDQARSAALIPASCNYYVSNDDVVAKVVQCLIFDGDMKQASVAASTELMSISASFRGDCLGPVVWFEDDEENGSV